LGGLQPTHLLYQPALRRTLHNWLWSVGDSPLSHTSAAGVEFTAHQADLIARNGVVAALNASLVLQAEAILTMAILTMALLTSRLYLQVGCTYKCTVPSPSTVHRTVLQAEAYALLICPTI
jgi:hypothetical protein